MNVLQIFPLPWQKLLMGLAVGTYRRALRFGVGAGIEHTRVLRNLDCCTVVDIGANRGQFALVSRHCCPAARVFSFEPLAGPVATFRRIFAGDSSVVLHECAIGSERGQGTIHVSAREDSSSLLPITVKQTSLFPGTGEAHTEQIRVERLSSCVSKEELASPALLKLDVQGYELNVLRGCEDLLSSFSHVYVECSFVELYEGQALAWEVIEFLQQAGFQLLGVYNMTYDRDGAAIQADFLFGLGDDRNK